jgi:hypothetical protein
VVLLPFYLGLNTLDLRTEFICSGLLTYSLLHFLFDVCDHILQLLIGTHSINAVFIIGDTALNSLVNISCQNIEPYHSQLIFILIIISVIAAFPVV